MQLTLITVCFKSASTIRGAMESVLRQRLSPGTLEYFVIDGGSDDGTRDVLRAYEPRFAQAGIAYRWISERDRGMYDALNKGIAMAQDGAIGLLNADDVLAADDTLAKIAAAYDANPDLDGTFGDIRFVRQGESVDELRAAPTVRYCSGRRFRPWMFRFGTQTAHPSTFFRKRCFEQWGAYSLDFGMYGDFELLCRFIWKHRARMRYLPLCTTVMRLGGASTNGWRTTMKINRTDLRALKANGCWSCLPFLYSRYLLKIWGFVFRKGRTK